MTLRDMTQSELAKEIAASTSRLKSIELSDFLQLKLPPQENILAPWLSTQSIALIYAYRGVGKTHVALEIAHAVASAGQFLGWQAPKPRGVLYLDGEMPANMMQERLASIVASSGTVVAAPFQILTPDLQSTGMPDLCSYRDQLAILSLLENIELIIVDNIATLCRTGSENDTEAWKPVQEWALRMRASGRSVLFIHHAGKKDTQRGASAREDAINVVIKLTRPADYSPTQGAVFEVHFEKSRGIFGDAVQPFKAQLNQDQEGKRVWTVQSLEADNYTKTVQLLQQNHSQREIASTLNIHKSSVSRYVHRAQQQGQLALKTRDI